MNIVHTLRHFGKRAAVAVAGLTGSAVALAQDASFTAAVTDITGDIGAYGAALVGIAAVGVVFMVAGKYVKKIRGMA